MSYEEEDTCMSYGNASVRARSEEEEEEEEVGGGGGGGRSGCPNGTSPAEAGDLKQSLLGASGAVS